MPLFVTRPPSPPKVFESWDAYLCSDFWGGGDNTFCRALAVNSEDVRLQRLAQIHAKIEEHRSANRDRAAETLAAQKSRLTELAGFPWVTPVLGSGCQNAAKGPEARAIALIPAQLAAAVSADGLLPDGTPRRDAVLRFSASLLKSRLASDCPPAPDADVSEGCEPVDRIAAAHALLCAYLLSRLQFQVGALLEKPIEEPFTPVPFYVDLDGPTPGGAELYDTLIVPLRAELAALEAAVAQHPRSDGDFVAQFADLVRADLAANPPQVRGSDASLMTELAWHFMTEGTTQYPGWSDLLVLLGIAFNSTDRRLRWPYLTDLEQARARLAEELHDTTKLSWQSRLGLNPAAPSPRDQLYDTVAQLLAAQASLGSPKTAHYSNAVPTAVAFVTSFDVELEMALLAARTPFRLVLPFYTRAAGASSPTGYVWLQTLVEPPASAALAEGDLDLVFRPGAWSMLSTRPSLDYEMAGVPAVVRLAGCPLVQGPDLRTVAGAWVETLKAQLNAGPGRQPQGEGMIIAGTVMLDEHTALHQWAADLAAPPDAKSPRDRLGLPERFVRGTEDGNVTRFWCLLGVQLGDDAVRQRVAAVVGAADLRGGDSDVTRSRPRRAGVVVNRRSTPDQRDIFLWQGLDVVAADYEDVVPALRHAAKHAADLETRRRVSDPCPISGHPA
jgi:hypothetical protein